MRLSSQPRLGGEDLGDDLAKLDRVGIQPACEELGAASDSLSVRGYRRILRVCGAVEICSRRAWEPQGEA